MAFKTGKLLMQLDLIWDRIYLQFWIHSVNAVLSLDENRMAGKYITSNEVKDLKRAWLIININFINKPTNAS